MSDKLDPQLQQLLEASAKATAPGTVDDAGSPALMVRVLVALTRPAQAGDRALLLKAGLEVGSEAGDILTGVIDVSRLGALAAENLVVKIEGSRPLEPERP